MNTNSEASRKTANRKLDQFNICAPTNASNIQSTLNCGFNDLHFIHCALPELNFNKISTSTNYLDKSIKLPLLISCMTGGFPESKSQPINITLAEAAEDQKIPMGLGSIRVALEDSAHIPEFQLRRYAPNISIMANIGATQLKEYSFKDIFSLCETFDVNALTVHLNCGQELFQSEGDRDFTGLINAIQLLIKDSPLPIIVKETGFGIAPKLINLLREIGVSQIDIAGAGGTNWILVEGERQSNSTASQPFSSWGISSAPLLDAIAQSHHLKIPLIASGGIRSGTDIAKALCLGASVCGIAKPFATQALRGTDAVIKLIQKIHHELKTVMLLTSASSVDELRKKPLYRPRYFTDYVEFLKAHG